MGCFVGSTAVFGACWSSKLGCLGGHTSVRGVSSSLYILHGGEKGRYVFVRSPLSFVNAGQQGLLLHRCAWRMVIIKAGLVWWVHCCACFMVFIKAGLYL